MEENKNRKIVRMTIDTKISEDVLFEFLKNQLKGSYEFIDLKFLEVCGSERTLSKEFKEEIENGKGN